MTNEELELLKQADILEVKDATYRTVEKIVNYFADVFDVDVNEADMNVLLDFVAQAVMYGYKCGSDTTEAIMKDAKAPAGEVIDVDFIVVEVEE